ncbi:sulfotransferase [Halioxenophilus sp. WMMB6]|uniref:sulfotransferase family protein n=1 Tax=Halioxenophilus sp. WMMB6 TaxID=3073815 RepID=UPI00295EA3C3|nr:sulfotransferase [Halioxenophilus sp. WMMB6]
MDAYRALLSTAQNETGLSDFGDQSFMEGLQILASALQNEAKLNATGEHLLTGRIVSSLKTRLQVEDWYKRHPEIDQEIIKAPLIGISLPRTGSTALSFLLAEDPNARSLRSWESAQPCPPPSTVKGVDPRLGIEHSRPKGAQAHVPSSVTGPAECQELMALDFKSQIYLAFAQIPSYAAWLQNADLTSTYEYEKRVLKLLQWGYPTMPWRLKAPSHLLYMEHLNAAFPDAKFVMTHRDPTDVMLSVVHLYADYNSKLSDDIDLHYPARLNIETWSEGIRRAMAFRANGNDHRFFDIDFRTMQQDPIGEVKALYQWLGEPVSEAFETGMRNWWANNAENREVLAKPDPATYGLDLEAVRPLFAEYTRKAAVWTKR